MGQFRQTFDVEGDVPFLLCVTAEAIRAIINRKSAISLQCGQFDPKLQVEGVAPPIIFARIVRPMTALQLCR